MGSEKPDYRLTFFSDQISKVEQTVKVVRLSEVELIYVRTMGFDKSFMNLDQIARKYWTDLSGLTAEKVKFGVFDIRGMNNYNVLGLPYIRDLVKDSQVLNHLILVSDRSYQTQFLMKIFNLILDEEIKFSLVSSVTEIEQKIIEILAAET